MLMLLMVLSVLALQDLVVPNSSKSKAPRAYVLLLESGLQRVRALLDSDFDRFFGQNIRLSSRRKHPDTR